MKRLPTILSRAARSIGLVATLFCITAAPAGHAQTVPLKGSAPAASAKAGMGAADGGLRQQTEARLDEALNLQADNRLEEGHRVGDAVPASERQRLLDRIVVVYGERLKLLDQIDGLRNPAPQRALRQSLIAGFSVPPPFDAVRVDLLRDELETLRERLGHLRTQQHTLGFQKASFLEAQRQFAEAYRLADDRFAQASGTPDAEHEGRKRKLAGLRVQLANGELSNVALEEDAVREEAALLVSEIAEIEAVLTRAVAGQVLTPAALDTIKSRLNDDLKSITAEMDLIVAANSKRTPERERLAKAAASKALGPDEERRLQILSTQIETDRIRLITLGWHQTLIENVSGAWTRRHAALGNTAANAREEAIEAFRLLRLELQNRTQLFEEIQRAATSAVRQQELRLERAQLDTKATAHETAILELLKQRAQAYQRVGLAASKFDRELQRWLADFGVGEDRLKPASWTDAGATLRRFATHLWELELFAVEDSTVVDGKAVSVSYGVTVGKSVGVLFLFALGYLVFSVLARGMQRLMVRRFGVDEQLAIVIQRWLMTLLMVGLSIFVLNLARIPLTVFAFMGGALAIGIGFGTQTIIKNFISGIIILFERKIRVGDIVALNGVTGHVTAVDMRASTVRGFDGVEALVPNSAFLENHVVNWTYSNRRVRREVKVGVGYGSSTRQAADIVAACAEAHSQILQTPRPEVYFEDFGDNALNLTLVFWVELTPGFNARRVDSDLRFAIEKGFDDAGIAIPFPQRDVHVDLTQPVRVELTQQSEI